MEPVRVEHVAFVQAILLVVVLSFLATVSVLVVFIMAFVILFVIGNEYLSIQSKKI